MPLLRNTLISSLLLFLPCNGMVEDVQLTVGAGGGGGHLDWNIGAPRLGINVISELKWKDLTYWNTRIDASAKVFKKFLVCFEGNYGKIVDGFNEDADYSQNGRQCPYKKSRAVANKGEVFDFSFGGGYDFPLTQDAIQNWTFTPLFGWSQSEQHVRQMSPSHYLYNGACDPFDPDPIIITGRYVNLHSNYRAKWQGPWTGFRLGMDSGRFHLNGAFEYHWLNYSGTGHWNLRQEFFDDFRQNGEGGGEKFKLEGLYDLNPHVAVGFLATYTHYRIKGGIDRVKLYDPTNPNFPPETVVEARTRLNAVNWHALTLVFNWQFTY